MRFSWEHLVALGASVLVIVLAWFSGNWFHVLGLDRAILTGGILLIGAAVIGGLLMWTQSKQAVAATAGKIPRKDVEQSAGDPPSDSGLVPEDITILIRDAESKVASARLGHGASFNRLRVILLLGEEGSGKTSAVIHSGLDPELLAGQVYQEGTVARTRVANFWFARKSVFIEAGAGLLTQPRLWAHLIRSLTLRGFRSVLGWKTQGERAAVVCVDCEKFVKASSADELGGLSRKFRTRLEEMSRILGSGFPVYVIFTGADRIPFFEEFVGTMSSEEAAQVLGVTLPKLADPSTGVYSELEAKRLAKVYSSLYYSLADHRPGLLSRENNPNNLQGIYEFPREFSKLTKQIVQFLVELGRPSQLRVGPFLRGFYFTGLRTVETSSTSPTMMATQTMTLGPPPAWSADATSILRQGELAGSRDWQAGTQTEAMGARKITQWVFLSHIFSHILLQDQTAFGASNTSTRVNFWRRALWATAAILGTIWMLGLGVSYFSNRTLESNFLQVARSDIFPIPPTVVAPSSESLQQLETLRKSLEELTRYERNGVPLHLQWGLYPGHDYYAEARRVYFLRFRQLLFENIQASMADELRKLPNTPGPNDEYVPKYDTLKAYLITTSNPDKSTPEFLSPVLQKHWSAGPTLDSNSQMLARTQFDFYAAELKFENPYPSDVDASVRDRAREYLNHFGAIPRIYAAMQNEAAKQAPAFNFYREHPDATDLIRSVPEIPGAFVKAGWDFMQNAIAHSDQYFRGEEWVLGSASGAVTNRADLETQLRSMYQSEFIKRWQDFLKSAKVAPYAGTEDEARKLKKLSANESPLLALICDASLNTTGRSSDVDKGFKSVQPVAPYPGCDSRVPQITVPYVGGLAKLGNCVETSLSSPAEPKDTLSQLCGPAKNEAILVVTAQIMPTVPRDPAGHMDQTVQALLEAPISITAPPPPPQPKVVGAKELCDGFATIAAKFPFNPNYASPDVTLPEFDAFFRPDHGTLQKFIQDNQATLVSQGSRFVPKPGIKLDWNPAILTFVNKAHILQDSLYSAGGAGSIQLQYKFNVHATLPEGGIDGVTFTLNGRTLKYSPGGTEFSPFIWPGSGSLEARISYRVGGSQDIDLLSAQGPWAIIRLLSLPSATVSASGSALTAEWHPLQPDGRTPQTLSGSGKPIVVHLEFESGGAPFVLQGGYFSNLICRVK
jgi:type VI secretion system protein ImpL